MIQNAKIESTSLGVEGHGLMTAYLHLKLADGWNQGFGGYALDGPYDPTLKKRLPSRLLGLWVQRILDVTGAESWEKVPGCFIRIDKPDSFGTIQAVGHLLKEEWFRPETEMKGGN